MSSLVRYESDFDLTKLDLDKLEAQLIQALRGRVEQAYVFGSFANRTVDNSSDIDLILVVQTHTPFVKRGLDFEDLFDIHPNLDILVYTPSELKRQLEDAVGFWKSVKSSMRQIL